jgi:glycosyltransferase involved in cell wall biosynthesis
MLESMACGLPVLASDLPANRAWIETPELIASGGDANALVAGLTAALIRLHDDQQSAWSIGQHNRERVACDASRATEMDRMAVLYRDLRPVEAAGLGR